MLELTERPRGAQYVFRGGLDMAQVAGAIFGVAFPQAACQSAEAGSRAALWLGPDEWLLLTDAEDTEELETALLAALQNQPAALVDVSHRNILFELSGPLAARILNCACPLDLDLKIFPVGMCTRTVLEKAEIIVWRIGPEKFRIAVWRSFAAYVQAVLIEGRRGLG